MSACFNNTAVAGCYVSPTGPQSVVIHYVYDNFGAPQVRITDSVGVLIPLATAANTSPGACAIASPDVEWLELCDTQQDGSVVFFSRQTITSFSASGIPTSVSTNYELDRVLPYTVTGFIGDCDNCRPLLVRGVQASW